MHCNSWMMTTMVVGVLGAVGVVVVVGVVGLVVTDQDHLADLSVAFCSSFDRICVTYKYIQKLPI